MQGQPSLPSPVLLVGRHVRLEPLSMRHAPDLEEYESQAEIWRFMSFGDFSSPGFIRRWVAAAEREPLTGAGIPFAILDAASNRAVGSTTLYEFSA